MESRDGSGMSPSTASNMQGVSAAFSAILNRGPVPGQGHTSNIHVPMAHPSGLHVPAPLRPLSTSPVNMGNPNPVAPYPGDGLVPHTLPSSVGAGMQMPGSRPEQPQPVKRKRGRPRKYGDGAQGGSVSLALTPLSSSSTTPTEKRRGRPPGSGKKQQLAALGSAGQGFTPHVITIAAGEDVASRIMSFSQTGSRAVCVLSANGAISNVTLRQPATSGGTVTYEGRFEILSLSGSFLLTESGGTRSRTGGLSVSLAGPDGRVVGGGVAGLLMAASPVQVVVGSFTTESKKSTVRPVAATGDQPTATPMQPTASPSPMHAGRNESPKSPESPPSLDQTSGGIGGNMMQSQMHNITAFQSLAWATNQPLGEPRRETDINIPLPGG